MNAEVSPRNAAEIAETGVTSRWIAAASVLAWLVAVSVVVPVEWERWREHPLPLRTPFGWLANQNSDTTLYAVWLAVAPLFWLMRGRNVAALRRDVPTAERRDWSAWLGTLLIGGVSLLNSSWIGSQFGDLPPAFHDEYSYLIQAETFLAGRVSYPSPPLPEVFDQIHVLNTGRFASRYFPGTGLWLAPWVACGHPLWGEWWASACAAMLFSLCGRELGGSRVGYLAGLLVAFAPGIALFSNLLLAHQPTLVGLGLFLLGWLRLLRSRSIGWGVASGTGLAFAMLCRPMTAAGFALPFGVFTLFWMIRGTSDSRGVWRRCILGASLGWPLLVAGGGLFYYNLKTTGDGWLTPYSAYTREYTPRHVYGFNNVERGSRLAGPRVMRTYDEWAENLTPALARRNVWERVLASAQWTWGIVPLVMALIVGCCMWRGQSPAMRLLLAAIVSLHAVHVPYWFVGIMHWHYVFETAPLICLWLAVVTVQLGRAWSGQFRGALAWWWSGLLVISLLTNYVSAPGLWNESRLSAGIAQIRYPRQRYAEFQTLLSRQVQRRPALVLIAGDPADRSFDLVVNSADLGGEILRGRFLPERVSLTALQAAFPGRAIYVYEVGTRTLRYEGTGAGQR